MPLPNGDVLHDMRVASNPASYTVYDVDIAENFEKVETNVNNQAARIDALAAADVGLAADAGNNIPNLVVNGGFLTGVCSPLDESGVTPPIIPLENPAGIKQVQWADCWFVDEDSVDALDVQSVDIDNPPSGGMWYDPENAIRLKRGTGSGVHTGVVFQRVDLHTDLRNLRGKPITIGALYTSVGANEFHIEVDDGVTVTDNIVGAPGQSPAGSGTSRHFHVVDPSATKLVIRIVLTTEAPVADADALLIHQVYARPGVSPVSLPVNEGISPTPRDLYVAQMYSRQFFWGEGPSAPACLPSTIRDGIAEHFTDMKMFDIPLILDGANTVIGPFTSVALSSLPGDPRDITVLAVPPVLVLTGLRPSAVNREVGDLTADRGLHYSAQLLLARLPDIAPDTGFVADRFGVCVAVIPDP